MKIKYLTKDEPKLHQYQQQNNDKVLLTFSFLQLHSIVFVAALVAATANRSNYFLEIKRREINFNWISHSFWFITIIATPSLLALVQTHFISVLTFLCVFFSFLHLKCIRTSMHFCITFAKLMAYKSKTETGFWIEKNNKELKFEWKFYCTISLLFLLIQFV